LTVSVEIKEARQLLPKGKLIGATVSSIEEALTAVQNGANYLGIGTIFATPTLVNPVIGSIVCTCFTTSYIGPGIDHSQEDRREVDHWHSRR